KAPFAERGIGQRRFHRGNFAYGRYIVPVWRRVVVIAVFIPDKNRLCQTCIGAASVVAAWSPGLKHARPGGHSLLVDVIAAFDEFQPGGLRRKVVHVQKSERTPGHCESGLVVEMSAAMVAVIGRENPLRLAPLLKVIAMDYEPT